MSSSLILCCRCEFEVQKYCKSNGRPSPCWSQRQFLGEFSRVTFVSSNVFKHQYVLIPRVLRQVQHMNTKRYSQVFEAQAIADRFLNSSSSYRAVKVFSDSSYVYHKSLCRLVPKTIRHNGKTLSFLNKLMLASLLKKLLLLVSF
jgi:hypothetical protein